MSYKPMTRFESANMLGIIAMLLTFASGGQRFMVAFVGFFVGMIVAKECLLRDWLAAPPEKEPR